jgi:hypothetical protein
LPFLEDACCVCPQTLKGVVHAEEKEEGNDGAQDGREEGRSQDVKEESREEEAAQSETEITGQPTPYERRIARLR